MILNKAWLGIKMTYLVTNYLKITFYYDVYFEWAIILF